jgi:hypothetical protein
MFLNDGKKAMIYDVGLLAPPLCAEKALLKWGSSERQYFYLRLYLLYRGRSGCGYLPLARSLRIHSIRSKGYSIETKL